MTAVLGCNDLHAGYGSVEVLAGVGLTLEAGDIYALVGKNGAGKTTLVRTILGVIEPYRGIIEIDGSDVAGRRTNEIIKLGVACAPQDKAFFNDLSVDENLKLGSLALSEREYVRARDRVVDMFPFIGKRLQQKAGTLSGGEQAMMKVARVLLPQPRLVLLDEVTEGLQPLTVNRVRTVLERDHQERSTTMLIVEQNVDFVATMATRYGLMERGKIVGEGSFAESGAVERIADHLSI